MQLAVRVGLVARRRLEAARPERGLAGLARRQYASILVLLVLPTHRHLNAVTLQAAPAVRGGLFQRQFLLFSRKATNCSGPGGTEMVRLHP